MGSDIKKGDKVKIIRQEDVYLQSGEVCIVENISGEYISVRSLNPSYMDGRWSTKTLNLEKVETPTQQHAFKVGDRVKISNLSKLDNKEGVICNIKPLTSTYGVRFDEHISGHSCNGYAPDGYGWNFNKGDLELIEEQEPRTDHLDALRYITDKQIIQVVGVSPEQLNPSLYCSCSKPTISINSTSMLGTDGVTFKYCTTCRKEYTI